MMNFINAICKMAAIWFWSCVSNWHNEAETKLYYTSIGSDNGLAPTRRQAIILNNDG